MFVSQPSSMLAPFVKQYWAIERQVPAGQAYPFRIVPNGLMELMIFLGDKPRASDPKKAVQENSLLCGHRKGFYDLQISGMLSVFSIIFQPHGVRAFFDLPLQEVLDRNVPLRFLLKDKIHGLEERLFEANSFSQKKDLVEAFLLGRLRNAPDTYPLDRMRHNIEVIDRANGRVSITDLAAEACLSRKQFERTFTQYIGTSPKHFLRMIRFQQALYQKSKNPEKNLTALSYDAGYYDQSHMVSEFKAFSGMTPRQFFADCAPVSDYFQ